MNIEPTPFVMQFLLGTYRYGIFVCNLSKFRYSSNPQTKAFAESGFQQLEKDDYIEILFPLPTVTVELAGRTLPFPNLNQFTVIMLTEKGTDYVRAKFEDCLTVGKLHHIYPILIKGDKIIVLETIKTVKDKLFGEPTVTRTLKSGGYTIFQVSSTTALCVSDTGEKHRIKFYDVKNRLRLSLPYKINVKEEMEKRLGTVNIKSATRKLLELQLPNLQVVALLNKMKSSPAVSYRLDYLSRPQLTLLPEKMEVPF